MHPTVSVIIPAYNGASFIAETIHSVLGQTVGCEIVVVDDGSGDCSASIVEAFGEPVRLVTQKNGGTAAARNRGLAAARGEWIAFLDQDDLWVPEKLKLQLAIAQREGPCAVYGGVEFFDHETGSVTSTHCPPLNMDYHQVLGFEILALQTLLLPAEAARKVAFDPSLKGTDDWDFCIRIARDIPLKCVPRTLARVRIHSDQAGRQRELMFTNCLRVLHKNRAAHGKRCDQCAASLRRGRHRINAWYYEYLREEIVTAVRSVNPLRACRATFKTLSRTPDQLACTFRRKARRVLGLAPCVEPA